MTYQYNNKNINRANAQKRIGRAHLTEPIIISGKYFGIKLLSVYEFMQCLKMKNSLIKEIITIGFSKYICEKICEYAGLVSLCLYDSSNNRVFETGMEALKNLTPEELKFIYEEYVKLTDKVTEKDNITHAILEKAKKHYYKKENIL